jgi:3-dehydroquinate dehydratase/shikimate dehydrogenase
MGNAAQEPTIRTNRLILRQWDSTDLEPFANLNADPRVREHFPGIQTKKESDLSASIISDHIKKYGWGLWAAALIQTGEFIGFIGLAEVPFKTEFTPAVEIGWRLAFEYWGKGYATEGAKASISYGFNTLNLNEIVSFTAVKNMRSRAVMERIGMHHDPDGDFDHPKIQESSPVKRQVLYRLKALEWRKQAGKIC